MKFTTRQIHAGVEPDPVTGSILTPIYQTTTFVQESVDKYLSRGYSYSRSGNPTVRALERKIRSKPDGYLWAYKRWKWRPSELGAEHYPSYSVWANPLW